MLRQYTTRDIFVYVEAKVIGDLLSDVHAAKFGITALHFHDRCNQFRGRALGARFAAPYGRGEEPLIFPSY